MGGAVRSVEFALPTPERTLPDTLGNPTTCTNSGPGRFAVPHRRVSVGMTFLLWLLAVILVIVGLVQLIQGQILLGIVLIVAGFAVGPGGWSVFNRRSVRR